jgi:hypothetical protein
MEGRIGRWALTSLIMAGLAAVSVGPVAAAAPAGTDPSKAAWVTIRKPKTGTWTPTALNQGNTSGQPNTVQRIEAGHYWVTFPGVGHYPCGITGDERGCLGAFDLTALSTKQRICTLGSFSFGADSAGGQDDAEMEVLCHDRHGEPADSGFTLSLLAAREYIGRVAYLFGNLVTGGGITSRPYNHAESRGSYNTSLHVGPGRYQVWLDGAEADQGGNVQVASFDGWCRVTARRPENMTSSWVDIACRNLAGKLANGLFMLRFTEDVGIEAQFGDGPAAYLWADQRSTASYVPAATFRHSSAGKAPRVTRSAVGTYAVRLPGMPVGGVAHVTGYGTGAARCQLTSIRSAATPQIVGVRCFRPDGTPVDSQFGLTYAR